MKRVYVLLLSIITTAFIFTGCAHTSEKEDLTFSGTVEADEVNVNSEIQGKITGIFVKEGDAVKKGDLLVQLDDTSLKLQEASARAGLEKARAQLDDVLAGSRDEAIKAAEAGVTQAQAVLSGAEKNVKYYEDLLAKNEKLFKDGAVPEQNITDLKEALENARSQYEKAKAGLDQAIAQRDLLLNGSTSHSIKAAKAAYAQAEAALDIAREMVDNARILSPLDGTVLYVNFKPGEVVFPGSPIMTVLDLKNLWVDIYIPEKYLKLVKLHESLDVRWEDKTVKGEIVFISPRGEFTPRNIQAKEERQNVVYKVRIKLPYSDILKPGMEVDAVLPAGEVK
ncbi:MAG TPA: HlyD family efflux transporter periplasmic adaptor subunit [Thermoanaerobacterales bacterium]|nr:HlyD family efflux transporter periplasmic adaptor subunit [Thermoanaerobacterales bacterium]